MPLAAIGYYQLSGVEYKEWGAMRKLEEMGYQCSRLGQESPFTYGLAGRCEVDMCFTNLIPYNFA